MSNNKLESILSFKLGKELLGVNVQNVLEVLRNTGITPIPRSENFVRGIVQFRGEIVTVIDFSDKLNLHQNTATTGKVVIIFHIKNASQSFKVGILADDVKAVDEVPQETIKTVEEINHYYNPEFLKGVYKKDKDFVIILDIDKIFSEKEIELINNKEIN